MKPLSQNKCIPCEGGVAPMSLKEIRAHLGSVPAWNYRAKEKAIGRELKTKDFVAAVKLIDRIAVLAEKEGHHPDLHLTGYRHLSVVLTTHAIKGLSLNDFIMAAKIDKSCLR